VETQHVCQKSFLVNAKRRRRGESVLKQSDEILVLCKRQHETQIDLVAENYLLNSMRSVPPNKVQHYCLTNCSFTKRFHSVTSEFFFGLLPSIKSWDFNDIHQATQVKRCGLRAAITPHVSRQTWWRHHDERLGRPKAGYLAPQSVWKKYSLDKQLLQIIALQYTRTSFLYWGWHSWTKKQQHTFPYPIKKNIHRGRANFFLFLHVAVALLKRALRD